MLGTAAEPCAENRGLPFRGFTAQGYAKKQNSTCGNNLCQRTELLKHGSRSDPSRWTPGVPPALAFPGRLLQGASCPSSAKWNY